MNYVLALIYFVCMIRNNWKFNLIFSEMWFGKRLHRLVLLIV